MTRPPHTRRESFRDTETAEQASGQEHSAVSATVDLDGGRLAHSRSQEHAMCYAAFLGG